MKGLLIKDFMLLKNQKQFFAAMGFVCMMFLIFYEKPEFVISYLTIVFSMFTVSTIAYDEYDNGATYLFTLPISRKAYVKEKYIFGVVTTVIAEILMSIVSILISSIRGIEYDDRAILMAAAAAGTIAIVMLTINIPIQLKFGSERGKMAFLIAFGGAFISAWLIVTAVIKSGINIGKLLDRMLRMNFGEMIVGFCLVCIAATIISYMVSGRIMQKKEF